MIAVDTGVWIDYLHLAQTPCANRLGEELRAGRDIAITDVVYTELLQGALDEREADWLRVRLLQCTILGVAGLDDFEVAAQIYRRVRRSGHTPRSSADCLIAAVCIREDVALLHDDVDFDRIAGVSGLKVA
ncbi:MAG TPA: PIN domain nuclease [Jatrophihabitantaceae bacterium]|nr:PIN domain nuclease [Jatrophihabitantaceae bacterium]